MTVSAGQRGRPIEMKDRVAERYALDQLVAAVRAGESRSLVLRGDPGAGKTELLDYLAGRTHGCRLARVTGVQSEMELAFAGLHQLCLRKVYTKLGISSRRELSAALTQAWITGPRAPRR